MTANEMGMVMKEIRADCSMTQAQFARALGISKRTVEAWEQGLRAPSAENLRKAQKLQVRAG